MIVEDDDFVLHGPQTDIGVPDCLLGKFVYDSLINNEVNHECMVDAFTGEIRTFKSLLQDTCNIAEAIVRYGITPNTVICISSENSVRYFDPIIASLYVGAVLAPLNPNYTKDELSYFLNLFQPKLIFCSMINIEKFKELKPQFKCIEKLVLIEGDNNVEVENISSFIKNNLGATAVNPETFQPFNDADPVDHVSFILSSSGTTGVSKGVMLADRNILVRTFQSRDSYFSMCPIEGYTNLGLLPFFHAFGLNTGLTSIVNKERLVVHKHFDEDIFLKSIQDYQISTITVAPPLAIFLAKSPKVNNYNLSCLKELIIGAAPTSKDTEYELKQRLNLKFIRQGYGQTEGTFAVTMTPRINIDKPGASGVVTTYMSAKVRDPNTGRSLGPYQVGEICFKGPLITKGYYRNSEATSEIFTSDGWIKSGDLGYYDDDKYFFVVDRLKELIKYKGYQVAPAELEAVILTHPKVLDAGVVGSPHELAGEVPVAFVVRKPDTDITEKELQAFVAEKVSSHKKLRGGIFFVDSIPKNPSGKILRRVLRNQLSAQKIQRGSKL